MCDVKIFLTFTSPKQFTDEHVNKRFQAHMFRYCAIIGNGKKTIIKRKYGYDPSSVIKIVKMKYNRIDFK
jgi:hypothetical protein